MNTKLNNQKRNVVLCGFNQEDKNRIGICDVKYIEFSEKRKRFPKVVFVDSLKDTYKKEGFILIINELKEFDMKDFDLIYRSKLKHFNIVLIVSDQYKKINKYSNIGLITKDLLYSDSIHEEVVYLHELHYKKTIKKYTKSKLVKIDKLYKCLKKSETYTTKELSSITKYSTRTVERYMNDINNIYNIVGYDYSLNYWYIVK